MQSADMRMSSVDKRENAQAQHTRGALASTVGAHRVLGNRYKD